MTEPESELQTTRDALAVHLPFFYELRICRLDVHELLKDTSQDGERIAFRVRSTDG
jgi:hypothetical protein